MKGATAYEVQIGAYYVRITHLKGAYWRFRPWRRISFHKEQGGTMTDYPLKAETPHYTVEIFEDGSRLRGYFEHNERGDESAGGLWFDRAEGNSNVTLTDYDGVYDLPMEVRQQLIAWGVKLDGCFYDNTTGVFLDPSAPPTKLETPH
jgi:hypothetical protein